MNFFIDLVFILFPIVLFKSLDGIFFKNKIIEKVVVMISFIISLLMLNNFYYLLLCISIIYLIKKLDITLYILSIFTISVFLLIFFKINYIYVFVFYAYNYFFINDKNDKYFVFINIIFMTVLQIIFFNIDLSFYLIAISFSLISYLYFKKIYLIDRYNLLEKEYSNYLFKFIHEIKNPLSVANGYIEIINKKNKDSNEYISFIDKSINDSLNIIEDYLIYGRNNVVFDYLDINLLIKDVVDDFKKLKDLYNMNVNFYDDEEEIIVFGDYSKLKQVFMNIMKNSIEARDDIKLEIDIDYKIVKDYIIIDITDNGVGADCSKIGNLYYTTKKGGTGLGINYSKNIIKLHNGFIKYGSNSCKGTNVKIGLPIINL